MHNYVKYSSVYHFADDTNMLNCSQNIKQLCKHVNIDLKPLLHWLYVNKISLNAAKSEFILFKNPRKKNDFVPKIKIDGKTLYPSI